MTLHCVVFSHWLRPCLVTDKTMGSGGQHFFCCCFYICNIPFHFIGWDLVPPQTENGLWCQIFGRTHKFLGASFSPVGSSRCKSPPLLYISTTCGNTHTIKGITDCSAEKFGKYSQVWRTSYFWALQSFQMFTSPLSQIKQHLLSTALLKGFQSPPGALKSTE